MKAAPVTRQRLYVLLFLWTLLTLPAAKADVEFNGFGQTVVGSTLGNRHPFPLESYTADPSFSPESLFALQVRADLAPSLSATAQIVAAGNNDFTPQFAWAYVSYQLGDHWTLKAGRQRLPLYQYSDYLQVGEAYPWVRPPPASYAGTISNYDGLSLSGEYAFGKWEVYPRFIFGNDQADNAFGSQTLSIGVHNGAGAGFDTVYDSWLSLRAFYVVTNTTIHSAQTDELLATLEQLGDNATVSALATNNNQARFASAGFEINRDPWIFGGEFTHAVVDNSFVPEISGYYIMAGYRWGALTPLLTYGHGDIKLVNSNVASTIKPVANPNPDPPPAQAVDCDAPPSTQYPCDPTQAGCIQYIEYAGALVGVNCLVQQSRQVNDYYEAGLRYDLSDRTAIKLDYTRYISHVPGTSGSNLVSAAFTFNF